MQAMRPFMLIAVVLLAGVSGCAHQPSCGTVAARPSVSGFAVPPCDCNSSSHLPRGPIRPTPQTGLPPGSVLPPGGGLPPGSNLQPGDEQRNYPPADPRWRPESESNLKPYAPPQLGDLRNPKAILKTPQIGESQRPGDPSPDSNTLPVDIPQFLPARQQVASGQKPFVDGLDWLRNKGYRTILHVRAPGEDDSAARRQITAKGFRYLSLEVSATTLNKDVIDEFNRIITEPSNLPLFAYDRDSSLLGGLWYLHFRLYEGMDKDAAAIKAGGLGLNIESDGGTHRDMWIAVQRYLEMAKPMSRANTIHTAVWSKRR